MVIVLVIVCVRVVQALNNICGRGTVHASGAPEFTVSLLPNVPGKNRGNTYQVKDRI
jgi:hypothetical protein